MEIAHYQRSSEVLFQCLNQDYMLTKETQLTSSYGSKKHAIGQVFSGV